MVVWIGIFFLSVFKKVKCFSWGKKKSSLVHYWKGVYRLRNRMEVFGQLYFFPLLGLISFCFFLTFYDWRYKIMFVGFFFSDHILKCLSLCFYLWSLEYHSCRNHWGFLYTPHLYSDSLIVSSTLTFFFLKIKPSYPPTSSLQCFVFLCEHKLFPSQWCFVLFCFSSRCPLISEVFN